MKFRKKPVEIEAMQWPGFSLDRDRIEAVMKFEDWFMSAGGIGRYIGDRLHVKTLEDGPEGEAKHVADPGDWIIKGVAGEFYPCKPEIFAATYEVVE
jgi:hypothetical protein